MPQSLTITLKPVLDRLGDDDVDDRDDRSALRAIEDSGTVRNLAEAHQAQAAVRYCELHTSLDSDDGPVIPGSERLVRIGGDGTPAIGEFIVEAVAVRSKAGVDATRSYLADVLDLRYRLPMVWARLATGEVELWRARKVAQATHHLRAHVAGLVDRQVVGLLETIGTTRLERIVDATVINADLAEADRQARAAADTRVGEVSRESWQGLKTIFVRADAGDAIRFDGTVDYIAELLALDGDTDRTQVRRAKAIGIMANPNAVLDLYSRTRGVVGGPAVPDELDPLFYSDGTPRPAITEPPAEDVDGADDDDTNVWMRRDRRESDRDFPTVKLYLHLNEDTFRGTSDDAARLEQAGPLTAQQARDLLGHSRVILTPVIDLPGMAPVDAYEIRDRRREAVFLKSAGSSCFPYSDTQSRNQQVDHTLPHPEGDSGLGNLGLLPTHPHRAKTHGDWDVQQPFPGIYVWKDPAGQIYVVDHRGTRALG